MKQNKMRYYIPIGLIVIYGVFMFLFVIYPSIKDNKNETYMMIDKDAKWTYQKGKWEDVTHSNAYNWQLFDIYQNTGFLGRYNLLYNDGWYIFDEDRNPISHDGTHIFAIRTNQKYKYAEFREEEIPESDMKYVRQVLKENDILATEFTTSSMFSYDLDSDGTLSKVFTISNVFVEEEAPKKVFNFVFTVKNDKITMVNKTIDTYDNMYENCQMYVNTVVDTTGDGEYEIITGCGYFSNHGDCIEMHQKKNKQYVKVKSCD